MNKVGSCHVVINPLDPYLPIPAGFGVVVHLRIRILRICSRDWKYGVHSSEGTIAVIDDNLVISWRKVEFAK